MFLTSRPIYAYEGGSSQHSHIPHFFSEKRSGEIKARACTNGSTQRSHIAKKEATALTVISEAILIQGTIFAHEE